MNLTKLNGWLQVVANIGILLGLVLVGVQLKQNTDLTRFQLLFAESTRSIEIEATIIGERGAEVWAKTIESPESLTVEEMRVVEAVLWTFIEGLRGTYQLAQLGLLTEKDWLDRVNAEVPFYFNDPYSRAWWKNFSKWGNDVPADLALAINSAIENDHTSVYDYITAPQRAVRGHETDPPGQTMQTE